MFLIEQNKYFILGKIRELLERLYRKIVSRTEINYFNQIRINNNLPQIEFH